MSDWRNEHGEAISSFIEFLNENSDDYILKGGTALSLCYGLNRFSEDIDLDGRAKGLIELVDKYCASNEDCSYRIAKDTDTVERCFVNYGSDSHPLKIEASYRREDIPENETVIINDIRVYDIELLCIMKTAAYAGRDKIRDVYDVSFIINNYYERLSPQTISMARNVVENKGFAQLDYVIRNQPDELIDEDRLVEGFLDACNKLGLLVGDDEKDIVEKYQNANDDLSVEDFDFVDDDDDGISSDWGD